MKEDMNSKEKINIQGEATESEVGAADGIKSETPADVAPRATDFASEQVSVGASEDVAQDISAKDELPDEMPIVSLSPKMISEYTYQEKQEIAMNAASLLDLIRQEPVDFSVQLKRLKDELPVLMDCEECFFEPIVNSVTHFSELQKNNMFAAYILFYIFTGKYPQDYWEETIKPIDQIAFGKIQKKGMEYFDVLSCLGYREQANAQYRMTLDFQRCIESEDIAPLLSENEGMGLAKLLEMFWEVFVRKYGNYSPSVWKQKISEFRGKTHSIRESCEFKEARTRVDIYAVSYEGTLEKPGHNVCEDYSFVTFYDENTWLAVSADGVGSCSYSSFGSMAAARTLSNTIAKYLKKNKFFRMYSKRKYFADCMYYLRFQLASDFYKEWELFVKRESGMPTDDMTAFSSTMQFAFGCESFIACGRIGDGSFYIRKQEGDCFGGMMLNDGISGVTQAGTFTVANLNTNPSILQVDFFRPSEITDIIISSDGVSGALGDSVVKINKFVCKLHEMPFEDRCKELSRVARNCAEYNETQHGSGDDSTIVHIFLKQKNTM